jgi:thiol-disulfide isomerase/thioredoxin
MTFPKPLALICLLLAGCKFESTSPPDGAPDVVETPAAPPRSAAGASGLTPEQVNLVVGDEKKLAEMVAAHKGKVVFVDYWATWCEPCVEYFPHTVEMHRKYKDQGLATIAVAFDEPDDEGIAAAREFLAKQGAEFENLLNAYGNGTEAQNAFDLEVVPHFRLYNRKGELVQKWDNKPPDADALIEQLLAEKAE